MAKIKPAKSKAVSAASAAGGALLHHKARATQEFGTVRRQLAVAIDADARQRTTKRLNQVLADTMTLRDLYKKHHWQVSGPAFYQLHLLFDKHFGEQSALVDTIAERIQTLGGVSLAMAHDVAETTRIPRPPKDREEATVQISRLLEAHEILLLESREFAKLSSADGDEGTNDMLISDVVRTGEVQVWFLNEHLL